MADNRTNATRFLTNNPKGVGAFFICFYVVGVAGILFSHTSALFLKLIPLALLLSFVALWVFHEGGITRKIVTGFIAIYLLSFVVEAIGVNSGLIFGHYTYGSNLGVKLFNTPVIIGINWFLLVYASASVVTKTLMPAWLKVVVAAGLMLVYDLILEQLAPGLGMWSWKNGTVPLQNYVAWFVLALFFHTFIRLLNLKIRNKLAPLILLCQFLFFILLYIFY